MIFKNIESRPHKKQLFNRLASTEVMGAPSVIKHFKMFRQFNRNTKSLEAVKGLTQVGMKSGKLRTVERAVWQALKGLESVSKENSDLAGLAGLQGQLAVLEEVLNKASPLMDLRKKRKRGRILWVPVPLRAERSRGLAYKWIWTAVRKRSGRRGRPETYKLSYRLTQVLLEIHEGRGEVVKRVQQTHQQVYANRRNAHLMW